MKFLPESHAIGLVRNPVSKQTSDNCHVCIYIFFLGGWVKEEVGGMRGREGRRG